VPGLTHRQTEILNLARATGRVMVEDLARRFEVSAQTIRKDLNDLCDQRSLTRIHGGAIIASGVENLAYEARRFVAAEEKKAIGAAAAARIPNGCSLFINIGTTTEEVASALTSHEDLLVITNTSMSRCCFIAIRASRSWSPAAPCGAPMAPWSARRRRS
jgi:DeoR family glycerol-3-phosphate regulon repressor